jgi:hypothetical protein
MVQNSSLPSLPLLPSELSRDDYDQQCSNYVSVSLSPSLSLSAFLTIPSSPELLLCHLHHRREVLQPPGQLLDRECVSVQRLCCDHSVPEVCYLLCILPAPLLNLCVQRWRSFILSLHPDQELCELQHLAVQSWGRKRDL